MQMSDTKKELEDMCVEIRDELENPDTDIVQWFEENVFEINQLCYDGTKTYLKDFSLIITIGGPSIYIEDGVIKGYWGSDEVEVRYNDHRLFNLIEEIYPSCQ